MELLETYEHHGDGYNPFLITSEWQIAQLNYLPEQHFRSITKIDRHLKTDEAFVLFSGTAVLIVAEEMAGRLTVCTTLMEPEKTYNVPKNVWHNIALAEDARVLIVENSNTHLGDFEFRELREKEKTELEQRLTPYFKEG
ncbi:MAG: hypothetical protein GY801_00950 [bacterium]|nr:hypothetical protein [bacterium]